MSKSYRLIVGLGVLGLALIFAVEWARSRETIAQTSGEVKVQEQVASTAAAHIAATAKSDQAFRATIRHRQSQLTAQSALAELQAHVPAAGIATEQAVVLPVEMREKLPASPGYVCLSDAQTKAIASEQLACDADRHSLAARESDVTDLHTELAAGKAEAQAWKRAAKGGSKWQRFGRVLKSTGCAAGGAVVGALATRGQPVGAAIGAGAGVAACSLF